MFERVGRDLLIGCWGCSSFCIRLVIGLSDEEEGCRCWMQWWAETFDSIPFKQQNTLGSIYAPFYFFMPFVFILLLLWKHLLVLFTFRYWVLLTLLSGHPCRSYIMSAGKLRWLCWWAACAYGLFSPGIREGQHVRGDCSQRSGTGGWWPTNLEALPRVSAAVQGDKAEQHSEWFLASSHRVLFCLFLFKLFCVFTPTCPSVFQFVIYRRGLHPGHWSSARPMGSG